MISRQHTRFTRDRKGELKPAPTSGWQARWGSGCYPHPDVLGPSLLGPQGMQGVHLLAGMGSGEYAVATSDQLPSAFCFWSRARTVVLGGSGAFKFSTCIAPPPQTALPGPVKFGLAPPTPILLLGVYVPLVTVP